MSEPEDIHRRAERIAKDLLDGLSAPDDPNQEALDAQEDRRKAAIIEASYRRSGKKPQPRPQFTGRARTFAEMQFAASLDPCATCGEHELGEIDVRGQDSGWAMTTTCPRCKSSRGFSYSTFGDPSALKRADFELGPGPSEMIPPAMLLAELTEQLPLIAPDPSRLEPRPWHISVDAIERALTCINELLKLVPTGKPAVRGLESDSRATRTALEAQRDRLKGLFDRHVAEKENISALEYPQGAAGVKAPGELTRESLGAHQGWLRRGKRGDGRLELANLDLSGAKIGAAELTGAKLTGVTLVGASLSAATLEAAELSGCNVSRANLSSATLDHAHIQQVSLEHANLSLVHFDHAKLDGCDLGDADCERTRWLNARVDRTKFPRVRFGNAQFDDAVFAHCDFRAASFAKVQRLPEPTTRQARFEDCDLRDTDWTGRNLSGAKFVRCQLAGARGKPVNVSGLVVEQCDVSSDVFVRQLV